MKTNIIKALLGLILTLSISGLYAQSPRIKLNQIVKDTISGSVLISNLADSNMVYSRNFYINAADTSLVFFGTTIVAGGGGGGSFVTLPQLNDSLALYATKVQLSDSMATVLKQVATDLTLTGDGSIATPLKVDTSVIATIRALSDSLATLSFATNQDISDSLATLSFASLQDITDTLDLNTRDYITGLRLTDTLNTNSRAFLTQNQTITLTDDATGTGTTSISVSVVDDSHNHTISTLTGIQDSLNSKAALVHTHTISEVAFLQDSLDAKANDSDLNNYLLTANYIVDSTRINLTGDTALYYQNGVLIGTGAIAGGGGGGSGTVTDITAGTFLSGGTITTSGTIALDTASAGLKTYISENSAGGTSFNNLSETADTVYIAKYLDVDTSTLYVDATNNRVGIGTTAPTKKLQVNGDGCFGDACATGDPTRALNLIASNGVMRIHRKTSNIGLAPATELIWGPDSLASGTNNVWWDFYTVGDTQAVHKGAFFIRNRSYEGKGVNNINWLTIYPQLGETYLKGVYDNTTTNSSNVNVDAGGLMRRVVSSSARYKTNINDWNESGIDLITKLRPRKYFYKKEYYNHPDKEFIGLLAEEVAEVNPYLVDYQTEERTGIVENVRYSNIVVPLIKAIQEQQAIIESQKAELETIKTQYNDLLQRIINLENK